MMQSLINRRVLVLILSGRSLIKSKKSKGPSKEPCGTSEQLAHCLMNSP